MISRANSTIRTVCPSSQIWREDPRYTRRDTRICIQCILLVRSKILERSHNTSNFLQGCQHRRPVYGDLTTYGKIRRILVDFHFLPRSHLSRSNSIVAGPYALWLVEQSHRHLKVSDGLIVDTQPIDMIARACRICYIAIRNGFSLDAARPESLAEAKRKPATWDNDFIDEMKLAMAACGLW